VSDQHRQRIDLSDNSGVDFLGFRVDYGFDVVSELVTPRAFVLGSTHVQS
jgi:hypothetical protein